MSVRKVFVIAMDNEAAAVTAHFEGVSEETVFSRRVIRGTLDGEPTAIVVAGIGKSNAAAAAQLALCLFNPEVLLNVGVAGALHAPMKVAEIYRVRAAVQYDFDLAQLNGTEVGIPHDGGSNAFSYDITDFVKAGVNELKVKVWDPTETFIGGSAKQMLKPGGCFYTRVSGIWQTVWLESTPLTFIEKIKIRKIHFKICKSLYACCRFECSSACCNSACFQNFISFCVCTMECVVLQSFDIFGNQLPLRFGD